MRTRILVTLDHFSSADYVLDFRPLESVLRHPIERVTREKDRLHDSQIIA